VNMDILVQMKYKLPREFAWSGGRLRTKEAVILLREFGGRLYAWEFSWSPSMGCTGADELFNGAMYGLVGQEAGAGPRSAVFENHLHWMEEWSSLQERHPRTILTGSEWSVDSRPACLKDNELTRLKCQGESPWWLLSRRAQPSAVCIDFNGSGDFDEVCSFARAFRRNFMSTALYVEEPDRDAPDWAWEGLFEAGAVPIFDRASYEMIMPIIQGAHGIATVKVGRNPVEEWRSLRAARIPVLLGGVVCSPIGARLGGVLQRRIGDVVFEIYSRDGVPAYDEVGDGLTVSAVPGVSVAREVVGEWDVSRVAVWQADCAPHEVPVDLWRVLTSGYVD